MKVGVMPFTAPLVRAILEGTKTQTRRVVSPQPSIDGTGWYPFNPYRNAGKRGTPKSYANTDNFLRGMPVDFAKHKAGDILWVREPGRSAGVLTIDQRIDVVYLADDTYADLPFPSRFLKGRKFPKWATNHQGIPNGIFKEAARLFIKITSVRVERVQEITEADAEAEVVGNGEMFECGRDEFRDLWDSVAKSGTRWIDNPWTWVYEFEITDKPANWPGN